VPCTYDSIVVIPRPKREGPEGANGGPPFGFTEATVRQLDVVIADLRRHAFGVQAHN
jgi:hypothetical protein